MKSFTEKYLNIYFNIIIIDFILLLQIIYYRLYFVFSFRSPGFQNLGKKKTHNIFLCFREKEKNEKLQKEVTYLRSQLEIANESVKRAENKLLKKERELTTVDELLKQVWFAASLLSQKQKYFKNIKCLKLYQCIKY